ncbi:MAG: hypothetical protein RLZZ627_1257 [Pseudomonadota bacterium]|jgi:hypothetical protein
MNTTESIKRAENDVRMAFKIFDARTASLRALYSPPSETDSLGLLLEKAAMPNPKHEHAKIEAEFTAAVGSALKHIDDALDVINDFAVCADYIGGQSNIPPSDASLRQYADQCKAGAGLGVGSVDLIALQSDIKRTLAPARDELLRLKGQTGWVERTRSASIVALRGKRFLLSRELGASDRHIQEAKLAAIQKVHDRRFGANTARRRTEITGAR